MDIDSRLVAASAVFLIVGSLLGATATFDYMNSQVSGLEDRMESFERRTATGNDTVVINYTEERALTDLFQQVDQSVVAIQVYGAENAQGSGFVYDEKGHIVTNEHVVQDADRVEVSFLDGSTLRAEVVGTDPYTDLAVLKVDRRDVEPLELGDSSSVRVGQRAVAVGNPFGLRSSMTSGIISQTGRTLRTQGDFSTPNVLQTDAAINPGNSGGPLLDLDGKVVGVNTAIESNTGVFSGVGFAIPSNTVDTVVPSIIERGEHKHSWIGVSGLDVTPEITERMELENTTGFLVLEVIEGGPADEAGVRAGNETHEINGREINLGGDVIVGIDNQTVRSISDILLYLSRETEVGQEVTLEVIRNGNRVELPLTLVERPEDLS